MDSVLTVRMDESLKTAGAKALSSCGSNPSDAVRQLYDYVILNNALPFKTHPHPTGEDLADQIALFDKLRTSNPIDLSSDDPHEARLKERYALDD